MIGGKLKGVGSLCVCLVCLIFHFSACKGGFDTKKQATKDAPVAEIKQTAPAPLLAPPTATLSQQAEEKTGPVVSATSEPPKGPITVPPSEQPPAFAAQEVEPALPEQAPVSPPPLPENLPPAVPVATLPGTEGTKVPAPTGDIQALSAAGLAAPDAGPEAPNPALAPSVAYEPKLVKAETDVNIIIDASGSQAAPFQATNTAKFDILRSALYDVISETTSEQADLARNVGFRVYGAKFSASDGNKEDSEQLIKLGVPDLNNIKPILDKVVPRGLSPINFAIDEGLKDFPAESSGDRVIILIADGADNTDADPCAPGEKPSAATKKTLINVVAFDIKPEDQAKLECIAKKWDGQFFLARNENELVSSLNQAINSTVPYNLKLIVQAGGTPMPFNLTIYRAGTEEVIREDKGFGTKLLRLPSGSYDILVEYSASPEKRRPSKTLKGVETIGTIKVEQTINFDLGQLTLTALSNEGNSTPANFTLSRVDTQETLAQMEIGKDPETFFLTPSVYDIAAVPADGGADAFTLVERAVDVKFGEPSEKVFRFQKGSLSIKGITSQKEAISFLCQVFRAGAPDQIVASAAFTAEGGPLLLPPGIYDLIVVGTDSRLNANPRTKVTGVEIKAAETTELVTSFEMGTVKLAAVDGQNNKLPAQFVIRDHDTQADMTRVTSENGDPVSVPLPPGTYDIVASSLKSILEPKPSVPVTGIKLTVEKPVEQTIKFILGTVRLRGRGIKDQAIQTQFTVYKAGTDEKVSTAPTAPDWMVFDLAPGLYDALAVNMSSAEKPPPMIWLRDLKVEDGKTATHEAIFTAGKLRIIGRGPNNKLITCHFKVFQYGTDRELINGITGDDWSVFEIPPGAYYLEASFHDDEKSVMLKKWINLKVDENQVTEEVLRF